MLKSSLVRNYRSVHVFLGDLVVGVVMIEGTKAKSSNNERKTFLTSIGPGLQLTQEKIQGQEKGVEFK